MIDVNEIQRLLNDSLFERISDNKLLEMINNKETFYVYMGDELCPWCRCVIKYFMSSAKLNNINKIYYLKIWDENKNEIIRDKYELDENNNIITIFNGTDAYNKLVSLFKDHLREYTLVGKDEIIHTDKKRFYLPSFIYIKDGNLVKITDGVSKKIEDYNNEITKEIEEDEIKIFNDFFKE